MTTELSWRDVKEFMDSYGVRCLATDHSVFKDMGDPDFDMLRQEIQTNLSNLRALVNERANRTGGNHGQR